MNKSKNVHLKANTSKKSLKVLDRKSKDQVMTKTTNAKKTTNCLKGKRFERFMPKIPLKDGLIENQSIISLF